ncbi:MAG: patatin-like phospholipase family protein [Ignavibacteriales bacterium]|nr:patatin-like phospholipase family protein [Ignavibacteriales bacterium]
MHKNKKIGLALSGGGFRAAAFHLGTLKKLNELGILKNIDVISTISGGSIVGAYYVFNKDNFDFFWKNFQEILKKNLILRACLSSGFVIRALILTATVFVFYYLTNSCSWTVVYLLLLLIFIGCFFYKIFPTTYLIRKQYDSLIYKEKELKDLPEKPQLIINSTNLDTGTLFSFTKEYSFDSSYKYPPYNIDPNFDTKDFSIAVAVACSTAVPYAFSPTVLRFKSNGKLIRPKLVDGGVYDNQGIYRVAGNDPKYKTDIVIVSDASAPFVKKFYGINPLPVLGRIMSVMMKRIKSVQFLQSIYEEKEDKLWEIGYYSLDWNYENCLAGFYTAASKDKIRPHLLEYHNITDEMKKNKKLMTEHLKKSIGYEKIIQNGLSNEEINFVKKISTSLKALTEKEIDLLSRHSEALTEIQVKLYCPMPITE